jgi:hypothetical protein
MSEWRCFPDAGQLDRALANHIAQQLVRDIDTRGKTGLAVSGGGTPRHMFQLLSQCVLDWSWVWVVTDILPRGFHKRPTWRIYWTRRAVRRLLRPIQ